MPRLLIDWLHDGELPVFEAPNTTYHVQPWGGDTPYWQPVFNLRGKVIVPLREILVPDLVPWLRALFDAAPENALLIVTFRTYSEEHGFTCVGVASLDPCPAEIISGVAQRGPPRLSWTIDPASSGTPEELAPLVLDAIRGRGGRNVARLHPVTREMYRRLIAKREDHQRRLDWDRENPRPTDDWIDALVLGLNERFEQGRLIREEKARREARARNLLLEVLSPEQAASLQEHGHFRVRGKDGRDYRIDNGFAHNVYLLDETGAAKVQYCIITQDPTPLSDHMLAQKLLLESCPEVFHEIANFRDLTAAAPNP